MCNTRSLTTVQSHSLLSVYKVVCCESNYTIIHLFTLILDECLDIGRLDNEGGDQSQHGEAVRYVHSRIQRQNYWLLQL